MEKKFVVLTKEEFESILGETSFEWSIVESKVAKEYVYLVPTSIPKVGVKIYSTVDKRTNKTRGIGTDAIRIVHWNIAEDKPIGKSAKILRTIGKTTIGDRIKQRVEAFVESAKDLKITDWDYVRNVLTTCADHGNRFAEDLLDSLDEFKRLTDRQLSYVVGDESPNGRDTLEVQARRYGMVDSSPEPKISDMHPEFYQPEEPSGNRMDVMEEDYIIETKSFIDKGGKSALDMKNGCPFCEAGLPLIIPVNEKSELSTQQYGYWDYPFEHFNPIQTATIPQVVSDSNIVIGASTSAGKTICAEFLMDATMEEESQDWHKALNRVIYLSPLKSLTQEKYEDWQKRFPKRNITILTGDYTLSESKKQQLAKSDIIVMTSEMTDSRTRRMHTEKNYWLKEVGLIIVDESHILSTDRGHAVESGLMRFTRINPHARILLLSATMPNCAELGEWITKLNGKQSRVIFSKWRPVKLEMHYIEYPNVSYSNGRSDYQATQREKRNLAISLVTGNHPRAEGKENEKFLVFCHDKGTGRAITKTLNEMGVTTYFHNADVERDSRLEIERRFAERGKGLRVLVSTSTLAWGRNLPARNVVIVGVHRGIQQVDELDIIQMAGRAGRYGIDPAGTVYLLCPERQSKAWEHTFNNPRPVRSGFLQNAPGKVGNPINRPILAFHMLAEIDNKVIESNVDAVSWFARSLAKHQESECFTEDDIKALFDDLLRMEMITVREGYMNPSITGLGRVSAWLYYSPYDVYAWYCNFGKLFADAPLATNDMALCWALADIPTYDMGYIPNDLSDLAADWRIRLRGKGITTSNAVISAIAAWYLLNEKKAEGTLNPLCNTIKFDIKRMATAIDLIDSMYAKWGKKGVWSTLPSRIMYGIPQELVELVSIKGVGAKKARKLFDAGIKSLSDLSLEKNLPAICKVVPPTIARRWMLEARDLL